MSKEEQTIFKTQKELLAIEEQRIQDEEDDKINN